MILQVDGLSVRYSAAGGAIEALRDVSLRVSPGVFGLLGPNGAGKSTLMRVLATLQRPDRGRVRFDDVDVLAFPDRLRARLGYLPQDFGLYPHETAHATLHHFATLKGMLDPLRRGEAVDAMLQRVGLVDARARTVGGFSGGMRQRLGVAIALIGDPALVIVDEPTSGLDPAERNGLLDLLAEAGERAVVILSTHLVEDVRDLCARVAVLVRGTVATEGAPDELLATLRGRVFERTVSARDAEAYRTRAELLGMRRARGGTRVRIDAPGEPPPGFEMVEPDLEDVYFATLARAGVLSRDDRNAANSTSPAQAD